MSSVSRSVDLTQVPTVPWAWVDERVYASIRGCSVKVLQNERRFDIGSATLPPFWNRNLVAVAPQSRVINRSADPADYANP
jgi:hypothetical protein